MTAPTPPAHDPPSAVPLRIPGDPARVPGASVGSALRSASTGARLGWAIESNWSDPLLFTIYSIARPVAAALIVVAMVVVVTGARDPSVIAYFIVGTALWNFVGGGIIGLVFSVLDDRERYRMLKYVFLSPASLLPFLLGRASARIVISAFGAGITLVVGIVLLGVRIDPAGIDWPLLAISSLLGFVAIGAIGIAMGGLCLQLRQEAWSYPDAVAGALYLVSGAVFPIDVLPPALQAVALCVPLTWWLEGSRRALTGLATPTVLAGYTDAAVVAALAVTSVAWAVAGLGTYSFFVRRARDRGLIDQLTSS
jgi:ABC-2 type transport system permease protein